MRAKRRRKKKEYESEVRIKVNRIVKGEKTPGMKILVADDANFMRLMICQTLTRKGLVETLEAKDGQQAVELFASGRPELTILDITMPELDGMGALDKILTLDPKAKVIICSAASHEAMVEEALQRGAVDFITKPFRPDELLSIVKKHLNQAV